VGSRAAPAAAHGPKARAAGIVAHARDGGVRSAPRVLPRDQPRGVRGRERGVAGAARLGTLVTRAVARAGREALRRAWRS
jgi:hypothetical protein